MVNWQSMRKPRGLESTRSTVKSCKPSCAFGGRGALLRPRAHLRTLTNSEIQGDTIVQTHLRGKDMITEQEWTMDELDTVFDVAWDLKRKRALGEPHATLRDKVLAMLFFFTSTRTRGSFEAGMAQLGGHAAFIDSETTQISHGDTAKEIGEIFGRYFDGIAIRQCDWNFGNKYIREVAAASRVPILNMQDDVYHPFQILADAMTIMEKFGRNNLKG